MKAERIPKEIRATVVVTSTRPTLNHGSFPPAQGFEYENRSDIPKI